MSYGRFRRAGKSSRSYGRKRIGRVRRTGRGYTKVPRFATVGFARNVEKKYWDKTYGSAGVMNTTGSDGYSVMNGVMLEAGDWFTYGFDETAMPQATKLVSNGGDSALRSTIQTERGDAGPPRPCPLRAR